MTTLTIEEILFMHYNLILRLQGMSGTFLLLHPGHLEAAVTKANQTVGGHEIFAHCAEKAAALAEAIIRTHPFQDGNKRVGITAGCVTMLINRHPLDMDDESVYEAAMSVADGRWDFARLSEWFETCTKRGFKERDNDG